MTSPLRVTLVQTDLIWHRPAENRSMIEEKIAALKGQTDLIVLPEMFTSGFTTEPDFVTEHASENPTAAWMQAQADTLNAAVTGSTLVTDGHNNFNRLWFAAPRQALSFYDKVHLFRMGDEHKRYTPGDQRVVQAYNGWNILLTVCYDLRFPVFCRSNNDYDLMLNVASWPASRRDPWRTLLKARAIENLCYVVGVNRVGTDGKGWQYSGDSLAIDFKGSLLVDEPVDTEFTKTITLDHQALLEFREKFPAWMDSDSFELQLKR